MSEDGMGLSKGFQQPRMYLITKRVERNENVSIWQFLTPFKVESWVILYASLLLVSDIDVFYIATIRSRSEKLDKLYQVKHINRDWSFLA